MDSRRRGRFLVGLGGIALSVVYLPIAWGYGAGTLAQPGPGLFPGIAGVALLLTSVGVCIEACSGTLSAKIAGKFDLPRGRALRKVAGTVGALAAYMLLMPIVGNYIAASIFATLAIKSTTQFSWQRSAIEGALLAVLISAFFREVLGVRLEAGLFGVG